MNVLLQLVLHYSSVHHQGQITVKTLSAELCRSSREATPSGRLTQDFGHVGARSLTRFDGCHRFNAWSDCAPGA